MAGPSRPCRVPHARVAAGGFTLLEVLVSFVILAAASGLLLGMLSGGLKQVDRARSQTEASLHAQSTLDQLGFEVPIEPGVREGSYDGERYRYRLEITPMADPAPAVDAGPVVAPPPITMPAPQLYRVLLEVTWGEAPAQRLRIATARARLDAPVVGGAP